jgi:hypothetical protein
MDIEAIAPRVRVTADGGKLETLVGGRSGSAFLGRGGRSDETGGGKGCYGSKKHGAVLLFARSLPLNGLAAQAFR